MWHNGKEEKQMQGFGGETWKREREMTVHLGIDRRMILKWILKKSNRMAWNV